jgi:hypothetical protein
MDVNLAVRKGYYSALNGNVIYDAAVVPIFDTYADPETTKYPYVILSNTTSTQREGKRFKSYNLNIVVDIVTGSPESTFGREQSEEIGDLVAAIVNPDTFIDIDIPANGFKIGDTSAGTNTQLTSRSGPYFIFRKLITFNHIICKL